MILSKNLAYQQDICKLFQPLSKENFAILLDSGKPFQPQGRYDIITALPDQQLIIHKQSIEHINQQGESQKLNALEQVKTLLQNKNAHSNSPLPFIGGWIGFAEYELGEVIFGTEPATDDDKQLLFWAGYYSWAIIQDHQQRSCQLIWQDDCPKATLDKVNQRLDQAQSPHYQAPFTLSQAFQAQTSFASYQQHFEHIQHDISAGLYSHLNFAQCFKAQFTGDTFTAYQALRNTVPSHYMAYINHPSKTILSISPECYLKAHNQQVQTQPIKGTTPRSADPQQDLQNGINLQQSEKNRLENRLTVEAIKKELRAFCQDESILAEPLYELQSFANVHHLVSTVRGTIKDELSIWDVFFACFPGSSICGSPKKAAIKAIKQYEKLPRGPYCGSIFIASNNGYFNANIAIRTFVCEGNTITAWAGGGITEKSSCSDEYQECFNKIQVFLNALEKLSEQ